MPEAMWYVVHTYSGYENKVANSLEKMVENSRLHEYIQEVRIPTEKVIEVKDDGKQKEVERKLFPCYVLVKMVMTDESWYIVRNTKGVTGFVGTQTKAIPLTQKEIDNLGVEKTVLEINYSVGDTVKVLAGPLAGFIGVVDEIDRAKNNAKVRVSMFGRETPADVELGELTLLAD